ncbi:DUF1704 domain-containing protein [Candidatus Woesearchaeota archaeon]|nr:DUF1704 domain-containing protein [Candidatus Woesearchaeota archaeon]
MQDFFKLKKIDLELQKTINPVSFFDINPMNIDSEKELVLNDPNYNPYFTYPKPEFNYDKIQDALHAIDEHDSPLGNLINQKRNIFIDKCEMLKNRGSSRFTIFAKKIYGVPSRDVLERSVSFLSLESIKEKKTIGSLEAAARIQAELNHYGFDYKVDQKQMSASAMVIVSKRKVYVRDNFNYSENFVRRLVIHEIGTHVLRAENGREQPFMIFFHGMPKYLNTEEGLAVVNEERFGLLNKENMKNYAARAVAVKMAMNRSFSDIFRYLLTFFNPATAFRIATRAKRGLSDTSKPGGCPKDYVYIDGYIKVKDFISNGGNINDLYIGKVGIEHLDMLKDVSGISRPRYLPKNQTFKSLRSF